MEDRKEYKRQWYLKNREKLLEKQRKYYQERKEQMAEYHKNYDKKYIQEHKEHRNQYNKQWRIEHKEQIAEYKKQRYLIPIVRGNMLTCTYSKSDDKCNRGECTITGQWMVDNVFSGQRCFYCDESDWRKLGCDRIDNSRPHTPDNVVCCCEDCNKKRGRKSFDEFCKEMGVTLN